MFLPLSVVKVITVPVPKPNYFTKEIGSLGETHIQIFRARIIPQVLSLCVDEWGSNLVICHFRAPSHHTYLISSSTPTRVFFFFFCSV